MRHLPIDNSNGREISKISVASEVTIYCAVCKGRQEAADKFCFIDPEITPGDPKIKKRIV